MEKDSNKNASGSVDPMNDNETLQDCANLQRHLLLKQQILLKGIENIKMAMKINQTAIAYCKDTLSQSGISKSLSLNLEDNVSPTGSPIYKYQNLLDNALQNLHDSTVLSGSLKTAEVICQEIAETCDSSTEKNNQPSARERNSLSYCAKKCETFDEQFQPIHPPPQTSPSGNKTQETCIYARSDTSFENQSLGEILKDAAETNAVSGRSSISKGKESANPKFRYKKRSKKPDVSSCDSITKYSKEAFGISDSKAVNSQSPKNKLTKISPSVKRKGLCDSSKPSNDERELNESCSRTLPFSTSSGNGGDHVNVKVAKKLKFEYHENTSKQYPGPEKLCLNTREIIENSQTYQSENERLILPSTSRSISTIRAQSSSEESSSTDESEDAPSNEIEESSSKGERKDVSFKRAIKESSLIIRKDVVSNKREVSCRIWAKENALLSEEPTFASRVEKSLRISEEAVSSKTNDS